jgi:predicted TIM-barrel fold metal-dependent hydrolase
MAQEQAPPLSIPGDFTDTTVVDCDVHPSYYHPDIQRDLAGHMDEPYASMLHPDRRGDDPYPSDGWPKTLGGTRSGPMHSDLMDHNEIREGLLSTGIDYAIVDQLAFLDSVRGTERAVQEMRAANTVLLERHVEDADDVFGLINVATRTPDKAAEEIDRMGDEDGIVGVVILPGGEYQKPMGDPRHDVIYRAAEDNDLTVVFHAIDDTLPNRGAPILHDVEKFVSLHTLGFPWSAMLTLTSLLVQGVPVKFPDLDFVILEAGVGWIPYMLGRLNREASWRKSEVPLLEKSPEEHIRESFYFGTQPLEEPNDPSHIDQALRMVGADNLLFASDYPHWDFDNPESIHSRFRSAFSAEEREKILWKNAAEAYGIDV